VEENVDDDILTKLYIPSRVETKIFVFVFSRKFIFAFRKNFLTNFTKIRKNWIFSLKAGVYTYLRSLEKEFFFSFVDKFFTF
jgi:hypothetical protein